MHPLVLSWIGELSKQLEVKPFLLGFSNLLIKGSLLERDNKKSVRVNTHALSLTEALAVPFPEERATRVLTLYEVN